MRVYTSLNSELQLAANQAVLDALAAYERRHGWKASLANVNCRGADISKYEHPDWDKPVHEGSYVHALVTTVYGTHADVKFGKHWASLLPRRLCLDQTQVV